MTVERIERGVWNCDILYGYGRLLRARGILVQNLPESVQRAQIANPGAGEGELIAKVSAEDIVNTETRVGIEIAKLVLNRATDWDKSKMTVEDYVETTLPPDVGTEIVSRVARALSALEVPISKKND